MSWFKRNRGSNSSNEPSPSKDRSNTDPDTCLDVFRSHWQQASAIINNKSRNKDDFSSDEVEIVIHNIGQMVTLLVSEDGEEGMPGPILNFFLEKDILELFCSWCSRSKEHAVKLKHEQLRMFEMLISQSKQLLLIHKSVIRPLVKLLSACTDGNLQSSETYDIEHRLVLVLHQACVCISQQFLILESFFCTNTDHGPTRFLLFSLLIPYIHREGPVGQHARDALLLIMTMSTKHPHIGQYIASNSDFCPVLAAGLSGLYSSLPRKIPNPSENWYMLTNDDCLAIPELQMFLNSLEFCNAVVQIAHPMVKEQLTKYIYDGFLLPVLGPALHQNSRDEVTTATAYLDLFLRRLTEPALIRVFLLFILTERNDEIIILDSLITRINSSSRLSLVSLALFKTLVELHCEDVMFQLVFKYLIPCTHVMVSQRRAVKDLDMYSKSAERFLSLRPSCCLAQSPEEPRAVSPQIINSTPYEMIEVSTNNFNPETTSTPSGNRLKDISSYVEITISGDNKSTNDITKIQPKSAVPNRAMSPVMDGTLSPFNFNKTSPFLSALFCKLEGMMQNTLYSNLLLTGILSQLAAYPQPLLRSFLLNHNLVFQPTFKSLVQVLSSVRHKVDTYSYAVHNFSQLLMKARKNLYNREDSILNRSERSFSTPVPVNSSPVQTIQTRRMTFTDLLFRKNSPKRPSTLASTKKGSQLQRVPLRGGVGYRYINSKQTESLDSPEGTLKTWNAVYCAIVLEEFLKELAALAQEHAVLHFEDSFNSRH
ncbi:hypothetical protein LOTGIDRAFT_137063 [Lottia gigantea]|uniref:FHF complex subunit HOOK-interacting protein C-terminal domain-containing protein n=1 Tax=Lottia gigantea TaxID=225164 RepID=V4BC27_LOTGI|nr:hypothetical protein LOTGIDRAFT_137063 [Lottia gigantea]ESP03652.1 hypothetical protein LOTGIDRAFT_137063 [Lottia gigantea]